MATTKLGFSRQSRASTKTNSLPSPSLKPQVGKVYGVVTTEDTPTKELYKSVNGSVGTIFYRLYNTSKDIKEDKTSIPSSFALPLFPQIQNVPLIGELVYLIDLPGPQSLINPRKSTPSANQKYYIPINVWNNVQQNSLPASEDTNLGSTIVENPNIRHLLPYEGDYIIQGRQGNSLRLSTTSRPATTPNEWSTIGNEDDPITILTNGLKFSRSSTKPYYVEQINKDDSSLYLTSAQKIPLQTNKKGLLNNWTNPSNVSDYFNSQAILNADRIVLNSRKDEVMIFANKSIELNTTNVINLNADERVHLNSNYIFLGPYDPNNIPQPMLLGRETINLFRHLIESLGSLAKDLSTVVGVPEGSPLVGLNTAGTNLFDDLSTAVDLLKKIPSKKLFMAPDTAIQTNNQIPKSTNEQPQIIQVSYTPPEPTPPPTSGSTQPPVEKRLVIVKEIDFGFNFESGVTVLDTNSEDFQNKIKLVVQTVNQYKADIQNNQEDLIIEVEGGESQVTNPKDPKTDKPYPRGELADIRALNLTEFLQTRLPNDLRFTPKITRKISVIGRTKYPQDSSNVNDERFRKEQYVKVYVKVKLPYVPFNCDYTDRAAGGVAKKENNFLYKESERFFLTGAKDGTVVKINFNPKTIPDFIIIETNMGIIYQKFVGQKYNDELDFNFVLATALKNAFPNKIPYPFSSNIFALSTPPEVNISRKEIRRPTVPVKENEFKNAKRLFVKYKIKELIKNIVNVDELEPSADFILPEERVQYFQFANDMIDTNWDITKGKTIEIKKTSDITWIKYKIYSILNNTEWSISFSCTEPNTQKI